MRFNFKKIAAIGTSILLTGMTMGFAAASAYPLPFVSSGVANVGVVYGTGTGVDAILDIGQAATPITTSLQSYMGASSGTSASTSGEVASIDTSADRIWLNTSLNAVKSTLTKSDLPTVLADYSFSGDVTSKVVSTLKLSAGNPTGGENSGKVIFAKQPESSDDPVVAISMNTSQAGPLYNASATMAAINFTNAESEGEEIALFGQIFTVAADTDATNLVLLKEAEKLSLSVGGTSPNPTETVTVGGATYTVTLKTASDTAATIVVTDSAGTSQEKEVGEADSKRINGIDVAVTVASSSSLESVGESASVIVGSQKLTLTNGAIVTVGEDEDPIDGTYAYIVGGTGATTEIAIAVFRPDSTNDAILPGVPFVDPVFGSFKVDFAGLSSPLSDASRDKISVDNSGDDTMSITFTEENGNEKSFDFAHNESSQWRLADDSNFSIAVMEMSNLSYATGKAKYIVVGNEDYGHLLELYDVYNQTTGAGSLSNDRVRFRDVMVPSTTYDSSFPTTEGSGFLDVDGKRYTVTFVGTGEDAIVNLKYPASEDAAGELVVYPTIQTKGGSQVALYQPLTFNLTALGATDTDISKLWFPDGDGYTGVTLASFNMSWWNVTHGTTTESLLNLTEGAGSYVDFAIGKLTYNLTATASANTTKLYVTDPEGTANKDEPGVIIFEGKDDDSNYHVLLVDLEGNAASMGTSTNGVGVSDVFFSSTKYHASATWASDSDITQDVDWFGTLTTINAGDSDQKTINVTLPSSQAYAQIYFGELSSVITAGTGGTTGTTQLGNVLYKDSEVASASTKNLIIVGGSCINSAAATLVGGAKCTADWTTATGVGSGQFLIQSFGSDKQSLTSGIALLVAGYNGADTVNAATYLINQKPDTAAGKKYIGTTSSSATLQVS